LVLVQQTNRHCSQPETFSRTGVGDFGFLLGIAAVLMTFGTLDYVEEVLLKDRSGDY
jgi:NADH:ubiquinone oxidoreductase subunit 5 (subunit L)/multisubunit Na+/H+ antiporter MnhA subunit